MNLLIVGLGNPNQDYQETRHNIGFSIIENLRLKMGNFSDWRLEKKLKSEISQGKVNNQKIFLSKPKTFMNESGLAVKLLIKYYKIKIENLIVIHDDLDLPLGKIKISKARGSAGHKGVQSVINQLKDRNFLRFRIGIKPEKIFQKKSKKEFVLQKFHKSEEKVLKAAIEKTVSAIEFSLAEGAEKAMTKFNCEKKAEGRVASASNF